MRYWRRAVWVTSLLRLVPFVRMVGLNGSMVTGTFHEGSDIDLYIVTKDGHIFVTRVLVTILLRLIGVRRTKSRIAGKICDNRFAVASYVDITPHDDYHARVFHNLVPLFDEDDYYGQYRVKNEWMRAFDESLPYHRPVLGHNVVSFLIQRAGELLIGWSALEKYVTHLQYERFAHDAEAHEPGSKVMLSPKELRFHLPKKVHG